MATSLAPLTDSFDTQSIVLFLLLVAFTLIFFYVIAKSARLVISLVALRPFLSGHTSSGSHRGQTPEPSHDLNGTNRPPDISIWAFLFGQIFDWFRRLFRTQITKRKYS